MSWYVIQTYTGNEERLVEMIRRIVPERYYDECFVIYSEQLRRRQQENQIHVLRLFPGYVFISSRDIGRLFRYLKKVPAMTKILATDDYTFTPLCDGEAEFLMNIMDADHIVRLSYVATDGADHVTYLSGPLERCKGQIRSYHFRKRYAAVRLALEGQEKEVKLGIILNDDIRRELTYGKVEAAVENLEKYTIPVLTKKQNLGMKGFEETDGKVDERSDSETPHLGSGEKSQSTDIKQFTPGNQILVMEGAFEGSVAVVSQIRKDMMKIFVQMFGREIQVEVSVGSVKKIE